MEADANVRVDASAVNALMDALCAAGARASDGGGARVLGRFSPDANTLGALLDEFARVATTSAAAPPPR